MGRPQKSAFCFGPSLLFMCKCDKVEGKKHWESICAFLPPLVMECFNILDFHLEYFGPQVWPLDIFR